MLYRLYVKERMTTTEIAEELGCTNVTIGDWLRRHNIGVRSASKAIRLSKKKKPATFTHDTYGYEIWRNLSGGKHRRVKVHRLIAVAEYGFDAVVGKDVHHQNGIRWDNRPSNLELLDHSDHMDRHMKEWYGNKPWRNKEKLREMRQGYTRRELQEKWGCSYSVIETWEKRFDIEGIDDPHYEGPWRDKELFKEGYKENTISELADKWNCSETTINNWAKQHNLSKQDMDS